MAGTHEGGKKAAATNKKLYGKKFYTKIGEMGGKISRGGGFAGNREKARKAGSIGGKWSPEYTAEEWQGMMDKLRD
jgi:general stress protein YciG